MSAPRSTRQEPLMLPAGGQLSDKCGVRPTFAIGATIWGTGGVRPARSGAEVAA